MNGTGALRQFVPRSLGIDPGRPWREKTTSSICFICISSIGWPASCRTYPFWQGTNPRPFQSGPSTPSIQSAVTMASATMRSRHRISRHFQGAATAPLHHCLSSANFITNIAESSFRHTHPIDSRIDTHQVQSVRRSSVRQERCAHTTKNRTEVLCPRVTQAAMIAAASFGLRRSGRFATATSGAAYGPHQ